MRRARIRKDRAELPPATTDDRKLGVSEDDELIQALTDAHRDGICLVRGLLIAQEVADACMMEAERATSYAEMHPRDERAQALAQDARRRAVLADREEMCATERWANHLEEVRRLIALADDAYLVEPVSWPDTPCRTSLRSGRRSRGHCSR